MKTALEKPGQTIRPTFRPKKRRGGKLAAPLLYGRFAPLLVCGFCQ